ncbi:hypothetical protein JTB14_023803 [Gonioctena quinquepunctata]|nr:hypothetical protein JTB14_023803 [Gonioctena quinquepunctata]
MFNCKKNPRESKPSLTHSWKKINFDNEGSGYILAADDQEVDQIKKEIKIENTHEDNFECTDDLLRNNDDLEMQPLKSEDEIDIVYGYIKPEIHGDKLSGNKSHPNNIAKIVLHESSIDSWKNINFDNEGSGYILAADDQEVDQIKKEIKIENTHEDNFECTDNLLRINADLELQPLKYEDEIDIVYEDIKPEIHRDKLSGNKSHPNNNAKIVFHESSIDFGAGPQQNTTVEEDETYAMINFCVDVDEFRGKSNGIRTMSRKNRYW